MKYWFWYVSSMEITHRAPRFYVSGYDSREHGKYNWSEAINLQCSLNCRYWCTPRSWSTKWCRNLVCITFPTDHSVHVNVYLETIKKCKMKSKMLSVRSQFIITSTFNAKWGDFNKLRENWLVLPFK